MRRFLPFGLSAVYLLGSPVLAAAPEYEVLQPVESHSNLILETARGRARIERQGAAPQRLALHADELLTTIAETRGGWTAAGVREEDSATKIIVFNRGNQGTRRLSTPALQRHPLQLRPTLAVQGGELEGMAWLEGPDLTSLSVRLALLMDPMTRFSGVSANRRTGLCPVGLARPTRCPISSRLSSPPPVVPSSPGAV